MEFGDFAFVSLLNDAGTVFGRLEGIAKLCELRSELLEARRHSIMPNLVGLLDELSDEAQALKVIRVALGGGRKGRMHADGFFAEENVDIVPLAVGGEIDEVRLGFGIEMKEAVSRAKLVDRHD